MSFERRVSRSDGRKVPWGVVELSQPMGDGSVIWCAFWIQLGGRGMVSVETDFADRANNICRDAWMRARRGLGQPSHIIALDEQTARRVRAAVPASVAVVVEERRELRRYVEDWERAARTEENTQSFFN